MLNCDNSLVGVGQSSQMVLALLAEVIACDSTYMSAAWEACS